MNNKTRIRLHLSKNLFESVAREVLAEAKKMNMSGGAYTEAVKMPKASKNPEVKATDKMKTMDEMSSKEKMAKGLYKEADMAKLKSAKAKIEKRLAEMEIDVAEDKKIEESKKSKKPTLTQLRKKTNK